jgi:hypothetical protein
MPDIDSIIAAMARELTTGDDRRMFRRVVRRHLGRLDSLRAESLDWEQIARKLTAQGARHKRGQAISAHQLRTEVARLRRAGRGLEANPPSLAREGPARSVDTTIPPSSGSRPAKGALSRIAVLTQTRVRAQEVEE